jgi:hypothetical protein
LWWWINHNVTSYSNNYVCNYFLYLRDPYEELVDVGFPFSHFRSRETFRHTFSTETLALCSFKFRVIFSRDSRETFDSVKLPLLINALKFEKYLKRLFLYFLFGCRTTKIATSNDWHQSPLHGAWHNLIDAKCRWRSNRLDSAGSNRELLGQRKEMKIHQVAITHEICCYTAQLIISKK